MSDEIAAPVELADRAAGQRRAPGERIQIVARLFKPSCVKTAGVYAVALEFLPLSVPLRAVSVMSHPVLSLLAVCKIPISVVLHVGRTLHVVGAVVISKEHPAVDPLVVDSVERGRRIPLYNSSSTLVGSHEHIIARVVRVVIHVRISEVVAVTVKIEIFDLGPYFLILADRVPDHFEIRQTRILLRVMPGIEAMIYSVFVLDKRARAYRRVGRIVIFLKRDRYSLVGIMQKIGSRQPRYRMIIRAESSPAVLQMVDVHNAVVVKRHHVAHRHPDRIVIGRDGKYRRGQILFVFLVAARDERHNECQSRQRDRNQFSDSHTSTLSTADISALPTVSSDNPPSM